MKYMGSKNRFAKELLPIILKDRAPNQWYIEPMVGGANMIDKVDGNRLGSDFNEYLTEMWSALINGWKPKEHYTKDEYIDIKNNKENYPKHLVGYVGFICSYHVDKSKPTKHDFLNLSIINVWKAEIPCHID